MRFTGGWIKLWRISEDHWLWTDPLAMSLWIRLLMIATYKTTKIRSGDGFKEIAPGTVISSRAELAEALNVSDFPIRVRLKLFENDRMIITEKSKRGTVITICNWEKYQQTDENENPDEISETKMKHPDNIQITSRSHPLNEELKKLELNSFTGNCVPETEVKPPRKKKQPAEQKIKPGSIVFATYRKNYLDLHGDCPPPGKVGYSMLKSVAERFGIAQAEDLATFYLTEYEDDYCARAKHPIGLFARNIDDIYLKFHAKYPDADYSKIGGNDGRMAETQQFHGEILDATGT